jgi:hypothetical protein
MYKQSEFLKGREDHEGADGLTPGLPTAPSRRRERKSTGKIQAQENIEDE